VLDTGLIILVESFPYHLRFSHNTSVTDDGRRRMDEQTDDNSYHKLSRYLSTVG